MKRRSWRKYTAMDMEWYCLSDIFFSLHQKIFWRLICFVSHASELLPDGVSRSFCLPIGTGAGRLALVLYKQQGEGLEGLANHSEKKLEQEQSHHFILLFAMDLLDMFNCDGDVHPQATSGAHSGVSNGSTGINTGNFILDEKLDDAELLDKFDNDFDFIDWLVDKPAALGNETNTHQARETPGLYQQVTQSMVDLSSTADTSPFYMSMNSPTTVRGRTASIPWPSSQSPTELMDTRKTAVRPDRVALKRTKSNPFYSPSKQIRNLVSKSRRKNSLSNLQKSYSTDVLPLAEQNVNVKRQNDERKV